MLSLLRLHTPYRVILPRTRFVLPRTMASVPLPDDFVRKGPWSYIHRANNDSTIPQNRSLYAPLKEIDPEVDDLIQKETWRQFSGLELIASEVCAILRQVAMMSHIRPYRI